MNKQRHSPWAIAALITNAMVWGLSWIAFRFLADKGEIAVEIGAGQQADVVAIFKAHGFSNLAERRDLGGHVRALVFG